MMCRQRVRSRYGPGSTTGWRWSRLDPINLNPLMRMFVAAGEVLMYLPLAGTISS
jgi:hypothetical protein